MESAAELRPLTSARSRTPQVGHLPWLDSNCSPVRFDKPVQKGITEKRRPYLEFHRAPCRKNIPRVNLFIENYLAPLPLASRGSELALREVGGLRVEVYAQNLR